MTDVSVIHPIKYTHTHTHRHTDSQPDGRTDSKYTLEANGRLDLDS